MIKKLPKYYENSQVVIDFFESLKSEFSHINSDIDTAEKEIYVTSADDISRHENETGIKPTDPDKETRRLRVLSKLQGSGVLTVDALKNLIMQYDKTGVSIEEDYPNYTVSVIFPNRVKAPEQLDQIRAAVEELKPAHIKVRFTFNEYSTHLSLQQYKHGELKYYTHEQLRNEILKHIYGQLGVTDFQCFVLA